LAVGVVYFNLVQECLAAGVVEEVRLHVIPVLLGDGVRLFESIDASTELELASVVESAGVLHLRYRRLS